MEKDMKQRMSQLQGALGTLGKQFEKLTKLVDDNVKSTTEVKIGGQPFRLIDTAGGLIVQCDNWTPEKAKLIKNKLTNAG